MTLTQFIASLWEQTRRTGPLIFGFLVGGIGLVWAVEAIVERWYSVDPNALSAPAELMAHTHTAAIALVLLMVYGNTQQLNVAIPQYALRLPVKTLPLIASRFIFNVLAFSIPALILWYAAGFIGPTTLPALETVGFYLLAFLYIQAWCWMTGAIPGVKARVVVLFFPPVFSLVLMTFRVHPESFAWIEYSLLGSIPIMTLLAVSAIIKQRRGESFFEAGWLQRVLDSERSGKAPQFSSADEAQIWFERRQLGSTLLTTVFVFGGLGTLFAIMISIQVGTTHNDGADARGVVAFIVAEASSYIWLSSLATGALFAAIIAFLAQYRWQWGSGRSFFFARPLSTKRLTRCRILASRKNFWQVARLVLFIAGIAAAVNFIYATGGGFRAYHEGASNLRVVGVAVLYAAMVVFIAWSGMWIENILVFGVVLFGTAALSDVIGHSAAETTVSAAIVCIATLLAYVAIGLRLGSFTNLTIGRMAALVLGVACVVFSVAVGIDMEDSLLADSVYLFNRSTWIGLIVALFVFAPLISTHFMLHSARHR